MPNEDTCPACGEGAADRYEAQDCLLSIWCAFCGYSTERYDDIPHSKIVDHPRPWATFRPQWHCQTRRLLLGSAVMPRNLSNRVTGPKGWQAVIVGIQVDTATVRSLFLQKNGNMKIGSKSYLPDPSRTAIGQAITLFGLTKVRRFQASEAADAAAYARRLELELDEPPISRDVF